MIRIALCDDDAQVLQELKAKVAANCTNCKIEHSICTYADAASLLHAFIHMNLNFQIVFLDIRMENIDGMRAARIIRAHSRGAIIIFVTALQEYVFDAFDVEAMNYLLKPVNDAQLCKVLDKALAALSVPCGTDYLIIKEKGQLTKLLIANILYCEAVDHQVYLYEESKVYNCRIKMDTLEKDLHGKLERCHRSYLINPNYVTRYSEGYAFLISGEKIPVAARRKQHFMKALLHTKRNEVQ